MASVKGALEKVAEHLVDQEVPKQASGARARGGAAGGGAAKGAKEAKDGGEGRRRASRLEQRGGFPAGALQWPQAQTTIPKSVYW